MVTEGNTKKRAMLDALQKSLGIVSTACEKVGISRKTHYQWLKEDKEYRENVEDISEASIDFAESKLFERINGVLIAGNGQTDDEREENCYRVPPSDTALIFYLKTKGKKRGYVERTEIEAKIEQIKPPSWFVSQDHILTTNGQEKES